MSDKELSIQLACATLAAMAQMRPASAKALTGQDVKLVVKDCYCIVHSLDSESESDT